MCREFTHDHGGLRAGEPVTGERRGNRGSPIERRTVARVASLHRPLNTGDSIPRVPAGAGQRSNHRGDGTARHSTFPEDGEPRPGIRADPGTRGPGYAMGPPSGATSEPVDVDVSGPSLEPRVATRAPCTPPLASGAVRAPAVGRDPRVDLLPGDDAGSASSARAIRRASHVVTDPDSGAPYRCRPGSRVAPSSRPHRERSPGASRPRGCWSASAGEWTRDRPTPGEPLDFEPGLGSPVRAAVGQ